jgi:predicted nucleic acid-binding protein
LKDFEQDGSDGVWHWFPVTPSLVRLVCEYISSLPATPFLRAVDAIHLTCAKENGFAEIYTNDRRMLDCGQYFQVNGVNLIP